MKDINSFNVEGTLLREHQNRMLEMLIYFDSVCRSNNIPYWLSSGTLLGAVRHGGFIPWDDDVDVEMMRKDYLKLSAILKEDERYDLQNPETDRFYVHPYGKLRDRNSLIEESGQDVKYKYRGIYIDIFVMEYSHFLPAFLHDKLTWRLLLFGSKIKSKSGELTFFALKKALNILISLTRFFEKFVPGKKLRHTLGAGFSTKLRCKQKIFPLKEIKFEKFYFLAPADTDYYLRKCFGDYMKLPNLDKIVAHVINVKLW